MSIFEVNFFSPKMYFHHPPIARNLKSSKVKIRNEAFEDLANFLSSAANLDQQAMDAQRIEWEALFDAYMDYIASEFETHVPRAGQKKPLSIKLISRILSNLHLFVTLICQYSIASLKGSTILEFIHEYVDKYGFEVSFT
jgi:hypothetical protein